MNDKVWIVQAKIQLNIGDGYSQNKLTEDCMELCGYILVDQSVLRETL